MADIHWIKLQIDMFDDEKIKLIDALPESDAILIIWIRLIALAGKVNDHGLIYIQPDLPYNAESLATLFNKPLNTVRLALDILEKYQMIKQASNGQILVTNFTKYQNVEGMEKIRTQSKKRVQAYRERQKAQLIAEKPKNSADQRNKGSNVTVTLHETLRNGTESDTDTESDIDLDTTNTEVPKNEIFDQLYNLYPDVKEVYSKDHDAMIFQELVASGIDPQKILTGAKKYLDYVEANNYIDRYIKNLNKFLEDKYWNKDWKIRQPKNAGAEQLPKNKADAPAGYYGITAEEFNKISKKAGF